MSGACGQRTGYLRESDPPQARRSADCRPQRMAGAVMRFFCGSRISRRINNVLSRSVRNRLSLATHPQRRGIFVASLISDRIDNELKTSSATRKWPAGHARKKAAAMNTTETLPGAKWVTESKTGAWAENPAAPSPPHLYWSALCIPAAYFDIDKPNKLWILSHCCVYVQRSAANAVSCVIIFVCFVPCTYLHWIFSALAW